MWPFSALNEQDPWHPNATSKDKPQNSNESPPPTKSPPHHIEHWAIPDHCEDPFALDPWTEDRRNTSPAMKYNQGYNFSFAPNGE